MEIVLQNYTNQDFSIIQQTLKQFKDINLSNENNNIKVFISKIDFYKLKEGIMGDMIKIWKKSGRMPVNIRRKKDWSHDE